MHQNLIRCLQDVTLCHISCGEQTRSESKNSVSHWVDYCRAFQIADIFPQSAALKAMVEGVETPYLVPIDGDMILDQNAGERIANAIWNHQFDKSWYNIVFHLRDCLSERNILALKIIRTEYLSENFYSDCSIPDVDFHHRMVNKGLHVVTRYLKQPPIGRHDVRGDKFCYSRYFEIYNKLLQMGEVWDPGIFPLGADPVKNFWSDTKAFVARYMEEESRDDYLWCIAGMIDAFLQQSSQNKSKDLSIFNPKTTKDTALQTLVRMKEHLTDILLTSSVD